MMVGRRYRKRRQRSGGMHPAAIAGICIGGVILLTVLVGNLLALFASDELYDRLTGKKEETAESAEIPLRNVPNVNASPFSFDSPVEPFIGFPAVTVLLNTPDGTLTYTSPVASRLDLPRNEEVSMSDNMSDLKGVVPYISGVYTPLCFNEESDDLFHAAALEETALLLEFQQAGAKELLLYGLPLTEVSMERVRFYVNTLRAMIPKAYIGIAIPFETAEKKENWEILATLSEICDFCALDLTGAAIAQQQGNEAETDQANGGEAESKEDLWKKLLAETAYYRVQYAMRLLLSETQTDLVEMAEIHMYPDYAIVEMPLAKETVSLPEAEETTLPEIAG